MFVTQVETLGRIYGAAKEKLRRLENKQKREREREGELELIEEWFAEIHN